MVVLKNIILTIVNIAKAFHYNLKRMILQMIHVNGVVDSIDIMLKANTIEDDFVKRNDDDNDTKIEKEIKRFLHGDDNDDDDNDVMDSNDGTSTNRTYTPYDGPYSETP
jgi:hypothetical protein